MELIREAFYSVLPAIFLGGPYILALLLGLLLPVVVVVAAATTSRLQPSTRLFLILGTMAIGTAASIALSGRVLLSETMIWQQPWLARGADPSSILGTRMSQVATLIVLTLSGAELLRWVSGRVRMGHGVQLLWATLIAYYLLSVLISGAFGTWRNPRLTDFYAPVVFTALALLAPGADQRLWVLLRWPIVAVGAASLALIWIRPELVIETDFKGLIPGFPKRLHGLAGHANSMGMLAAVGLLLELSSFVRRRPALFFVVVNLAVLLLAQSKTAWAAALLGLLLVRWSWMRQRLSPGDPQRAGAVVVAFGCVLMAVLAMVLFLGSQSEGLRRFAENTSLFTLTGRTDIWRVTFDEFLRSPVIGYGPSIWDPLFRIEHRIIYAGQAHNQFIQTLGQAGLLGIGALLLHLSVVSREVLRGRAVMQGLGVVLLMILLARCLSESPMRMGGIIGFDGWFQMLVFVAAGFSAMHKRAQIELAPVAPSSIPPNSSVTAKRETEAAPIGAA